MIEASGTITSMLNIAHKVFSPIATAIFAGLVLYGYSPDSTAWGSDGHTAIGVLTIEQLQPAARRELEFIAGPLDDQSMMKACNWPDAIRETEKWAWASPRHYINIPRGESVYLESRDCPDHICNTEAIKDSATQLGNRQAGKGQRWQAFAWLCHLVGDLHQPLHAGFAGPCSIVAQICCDPGQFPLVA